MEPLVGTLGLIIGLINIFAAGEMYAVWKQRRDKDCWAWIIFNTLIGVYCIISAIGIFVRENQL